MSQGHVVNSLLTVMDIRRLLHWWVYFTQFYALNSTFLELTLNKCESLHISCLERCHCGVHTKEPLHIHVHMHTLKLKL